MTKTEKATRWMENVAGDNAHGYDKDFRWGQRGDYDCSAATITAWEKAGVPVKSAGAVNTSNIYEVFTDNGFKDVTAKVNLNSGKGLKRGDVLLRKGRHVAMYCGAGKEVEASINEMGTGRGGKPGDQTGREFLIRSYRNYPWSHVLRYSEGVFAKKSVLKDDRIEKVAREVIAGKWGNGAERFQRLKKAGYDPDKVQKKVNELLRH